MIDLERDELEIEYRISENRIWDADPGVCCRYFQTGACAHTEGGYTGYDFLTPEAQAEIDARTSATLARYQAEQAAALARLEAVYGPDGPPF